MTDKIPTHKPEETKEFEELARLRGRLSAMRRDLANISEYDAHSRAIIEAHDEELKSLRTEYTKKQAQLTEAITDDDLAKVDALIFSLELIQDAVEASQEVISAENTNIEDSENMRRFFDEYAQEIEALEERLDERIN